MPNKTDLQTVLREIRQHAGPLVALSPLDPALLRKSMRAIRAAYSARKRPSWLTVNANPEGCNQYTGPGCASGGRNGRTVRAWIDPEGEIHDFEKLDNPDSTPMSHAEWVRESQGLTLPQAMSKGWQRVVNDGKTIRVEGDVHPTPLQKIALKKIAGTDFWDSRWTPRKFDSDLREIELIVNTSSNVGRDQFSSQRTAGRRPSWLRTIPLVTNCGGPGSGKPGPCPDSSRLDHPDTSQEAERRINAVTDDVFGWGGEKDDYELAYRKIKLPGNRYIEISHKEYNSKTPHVVQIDFGIEGEDNTYQNETMGRESLGLLRKIREAVQKYHERGLKISFIASDKKRKEAYDRVLSKTLTGRQELAGGRVVYNTVNHGQFSSQRSPWRVTIRRLAPYLLDLMPDLTKAQAEGIARSIQLGLRSDAPDSEVADMIEQYGVEPERAVLIARTEMARARADTELGRLKPNERVVYVLADGACPKCVKVKRKLKERRLTAKQAEGIVPVHPNCYCRWKVVNRKSGREIVRNDSNGLEQVRNDVLEYSRLVENVFCATGEGGGVDPSCEDDAPNAQDILDRTLSAVRTKLKTARSDRAERLANDVKTLESLDSVADVDTIKKLADKYGVLTPLKIINPTVSPSTSGLTAEVKDERPAPVDPEPKTKRTLRGKIEVRGSATASREIDAALSKIPERALDDSKIKQITAYSESIENPTGIVGDVLGHRVGATVRLYPGFDESTVTHEIGHGLQRVHLKRYQFWLSKTGKKKGSGGYGTEDSRLKEAFANSFSSYVKYGSHPFWNDIYGQTIKPT